MLVIWRTSNEQARFCQTLTISLDVFSSVPTNPNPVASQLVYRPQGDNLTREAIDGDGVKFAAVSTGSSPQPYTACVSCGEYPEPFSPPGRSCSLISVSSSFPSVTTMSQKSSVMAITSIYPKGADVGQLGELPASHQPYHFSNEAWDGPFDGVIPLLEEALARNLRNIRKQLVMMTTEEVSDALVAVLGWLCAPDPAKRGHPRDRNTMAPHNVQRFVSTFNMLATKGGIQTVRGRH